MTELQQRLEEPPLRIEGDIPPELLMLPSISISIAMGSRIANSAGTGGRIDISRIFDHTFDHTFG